MPPLVVACVALLRQLMCTSYSMRGTWSRAVVVGCAGGGTQLLQRKRRTVVTEGATFRYTDPLPVQRVLS